MATWQDILIALKCCLKDDAAMAFAMNVSGKLHLPLEAPIVINFHYYNTILRCRHLQQSAYITTQTGNWHLFIKQAIRWGQLPSEERALLQAERQVKFLNHVQAEPSEMEGINIFEESELLMDCFVVQQTRFFFEAHSFE